MRRILRKIAEGEVGNLGDTSTLADPGWWRIWSRGGPCRIRFDRRRSNLPGHPSILEVNASRAARGDLVDVFVESRENDDGLISLSKEKADKMKVWDEISGACERDEIIEGTISQLHEPTLPYAVKLGFAALVGSALYFYLLRAGREPMVETATSSP